MPTLDELGTKQSAVPAKRAADTSKVSIFILVSVLTAPGLSSLGWDQDGTVRLGATPNQGFNNKMSGVYMIETAENASSRKDRRDVEQSALLCAPWFPRRLEVDALSINKH